MPKKVNKKKVELLSPVSSFETLKAAILAGCDAVYLSGKKYGARAYAKNFTDHELIEALNYAHLYNVKVYVTVNTLIYEREMDDFLEYIFFLHKNGVDAVIMQDIGAMDVVRKIFPNLEIHASTQMNIHSKESAQLLQKLKIKRAVLAREMNLSLIKEIKEDVDLELEVFVQGALCVCYSGLCLMSSMIGGRSGNRGTCAQCCRMPYSLIKDGKKIKKEEYLLSTKDLCTLKYLDQLLEIGVDSLKIEGRMKRCEYVFFTTYLYRKAIDSYYENGYVSIKEEDITSLKKLFNRGFTKGFLFQEENDSFIHSYRPNHMGVFFGDVIKRGKDFFLLKLEDDLNVQDGIRLVDSDIGFLVQEMYQKNKKVKSAKKGEIVEIRKKIPSCGKVVKTTDFKQLQEIRTKLKEEKKLPLSMHLEAKIGQPLRLFLTYQDDKVAIESSYIVEKSRTSQTTKKDIKEKLSQLNDTIYYLSNLTFSSDDDIFIPVFRLKELRREGVGKLNEKRLQRKDVVRCEYKIEVKDYKREQKKAILVDTDKQVVGYDEVYNYQDMDNTTLKLNRILERHEKRDKRVLVSDLGSLLVYRNVVADFSFNVVNSYSIAFLHSLGVDKVTLSYELTYDEIKEILNSYHKRYQKHPNVEVIVDSYPEVMVCKYLLDGDFLEDKFHNRFPIRIRDGFMHLYFYKRKILTDDFYKIGVNSIRYHKEL